MHVEPLHLRVYVEYQRTVLRYAQGLRRYHSTFPLSVSTTLRSLAQAVSVGIALLQLFDEWAGEGGAGCEEALPPLLLPAYSSTLTFRGAFAAAGSPSFAYVGERSLAASRSYYEDMAAGATAGNGSSGISGGGGSSSSRSNNGADALPSAAIRLLRYAAASQTGKALWALLAGGGCMDDVRRECEKVLQWIAAHRPPARTGSSAAGGTVCAPPTPAAALDAEVLGEASSPRKRDAAWSLALACLSAAARLAPESAAQAEAALELHDATIEYVAAHATCERVEPACTDLDPMACATSTSVMLVDSDGPTGSGSSALDDSAELPLALAGGLVLTSPSRRDPTPEWSAAVAAWALPPPALRPAPPARAVASHRRLYSLLSANAAALVDALAAQGVHVVEGEFVDMYELPGIALAAGGEASTPRLPRYTPTSPLVTTPLPGALSPALLPVKSIAAASAATSSALVSASACEAHSPHHLGARRLRSGSLVCMAPVSELAPADDGGGGGMTPGSDEACTGASDDEEACDDGLARASGSKRPRPASSGNSPVADGIVTEAPVALETVAEADSTAPLVASMPALGVSMTSIPSAPVSPSKRPRMEGSRTEQNDASPPRAPPPGAASSGGWGSPCTTTSGTLLHAPSSSAFTARSPPRPTYSPAAAGAAAAGSPASGAASASRMRDIVSGQFAALVLQRDDSGTGSGSAEENATQAPAPAPTPTPAIGRAEMQRLLPRASGGEADAGMLPLAELQPMPSPSFVAASSLTAAATCAPHPLPLRCEPSPLLPSILRSSLGRASSQGSPFEGGSSFCEAASGGGGGGCGSSSVASRPPSRGSVRWSQRVLEVEEGRRRVRVASVDELRYGPDGAALSTAVDRSMVEAAHLRAAEGGMSPVVVVRAASLGAGAGDCVGARSSSPGGFSPRARAGSSPSPDEAAPSVDISLLPPPAAALTAPDTALDGCNPMLPFKLSVKPILPAGPLPPSAGAASRLRDAWPLASPSLRCLPANPPRHSPLSTAFCYRLWQLLHHRRSLGAAATDGTTDDPASAASPRAVHSHGAGGLGAGAGGAPLSRRMHSMSIDSVASIASIASGALSPDRYMSSPAAEVRFSVRPESAAAQPGRSPPPLLPLAELLPSIVSSPAPAAMRGNLTPLLQPWRPVASAATAATAATRSPPSAASPASPPSRATNPRTRTRSRCGVMDGVDDSELARPLALGLLLAAVGATAAADTSPNTADPVDLASTPIVASDNPEPPLAFSPVVASGIALISDPASGHVVAATAAVSSRAASATPRHLVFGLSPEPAAPTPQASAAAQVPPLSPRSARLGVYATAAAAHGATGARPSAHAVAAVASAVAGISDAHRTAEIDDDDCRDSHVAALKRALLAAAGEVIFFELAPGASVPQPTAVREFLRRLSAGTGATKVAESGKASPHVGRSDALLVELADGTMRPRMQLFASPAAPTLASL